MSRCRRIGEDSDPAHGLDGRAPSGYRFFERLYVRGLRTRVGLDAQWTPGRWRLAGELLQARDERREQGLDLEDLPSVIGTGWNIAVTKQIGRRQPRVRLRELEVGLRFDRLSFDDAAPATDRDSVRLRATDVRARGADSLTATIAWSPMRWTRLLANVGVERYAERRSAPTAGTLGPYWVLGTRLQLELP